MTKSCKSDCTPYELVDRKRPNLAIVRVIGRNALVLKWKEKQKGKFDLRAVGRILVGFCKGNAYCVFMRSENKVIESQDVTVREPHEPDSTVCAKENLIILNLTDSDIIFDNAESFNRDLVSDHEEEEENTDYDSKDYGFLDSYEPSTSDESSPGEEDVLEALTYYSGLRRSTRHIAGNPPNQYCYDTAYLLVNLEGEKGELSPSFECTMSPSGSDRWLEFLSLEFDYFPKLGTSDLVHLPPGRNFMKTKWVIDKKLDGKGNVSRYKKRLVDKEFSQVPGVDFHEVFLPVTPLCNSPIYVCFGRVVWMNKDAH